MFYSDVPKIRVVYYTNMSTVSCRKAIITSNFERNFDQGHSTFTSKYIQIKRSHTVAGFQHSMLQKY